MMDWLTLGFAGFLGGLLNAVAGGGSFITLPALIYVGVPPITANATGTAALLPGYIASAWRFRHDVEVPGNLSLRNTIVIALIGGSIGAAVLLKTNDQQFSQLIPWLILFATFAFIVGPKFLEIKNTQLSVFTASFILLLVCVYGGYFNGGLGIILLASFGLMGQTNLNGMNGLKNIISAVLTAIAVLLYIIGDVIEWKYLLFMGVSALIGGYLGAAIAYKIPSKLMRWFIIFIGLLMAMIFFIRV